MTTETENIKISENKTINVFKIVTCGGKSSGFMVEIFVKLRFATLKPTIYLPKVQLAIHKPITIHLFMSLFIQNFAAKLCCRPRTSSLHLNKSDVTWKHHNITLSIQMSRWDFASAVEWRGHAKIIRILFTECTCSLAQISSFTPIGSLVTEDWQI